MERCVYKKVFNYLVNNKLLYSKQSGFLTGHSTIYQLIDLYVISSVRYLKLLTGSGISVFF